MLVDATGSIEITEIRDNDGKVLSKKKANKVKDKLSSGDYVLDLRNCVIHSIGSDFKKVGDFDWMVNNMEYDFDFWEED